MAIKFLKIESCCRSCDDYHIISVELR
ncbi:hypothetical protein EU811_20355 [Arthrobacter sp. TS-15]|nr:hypothetical protein C9924_00295 [Alloalcanivorax venustensis]PTB82199.1 hypothetical protein C9924_00325 [Alloalcanivorax venustensis]PTB90715.1 hypothetical protein C9974_17035 [Marinobacter sp. B9-2]RBK15600.1 hypothetical protein BRN96_09820 [Xanthomonas oryzae pv. oryzae]TQS89208.1 hypothetical protein EU811_20355 [Arthrobacter sp. TS-15]